MRRLLMPVLLSLALAPATSHADEPAGIEAIDAGDRVLVIARGMAAASLEPSSRGDRVEVKLAGDVSPREIAVRDRTVKSMDVRGRGQRRLSIQLRHGRETTVKMASVAQVVQLGHDLQVILPRDPDAVTQPRRAAPSAPAPKPVTTEPPAAEPPAAAVAPATEPVEPVEPVEADAEVTEEPPAIAGTTATEAAAPPAGDGPTDDYLAARAQDEGSEAPSSSGFGGIILSLGILAAGGGLAWYVKNKRRPPAIDDSIEVIASRAIGTKSRIVWLAAGKREMIVSVAVPVQRFRAVLGVLQLSTQGGAIDEIIRAERLAMFRVFAVAVIVNVILSFLLAGTIANPLRRLSAAAVRVRRSIKNREEIPDFSERQDEIGNLSVALRDMTNALYARIDAIESFAADVSHELKNPLTSLRSAVETLPRAATDESRMRLLKVIEHDVRRLDRLITDISDASRLDAELAREDAGTVDLHKLLRNMISVLADAHIGHVTPKLHVDARPAQGSFTVPGHESRLGQVISNLVENARSFVDPETGRIDIRLSARPRWVEIRVEDNGPGIRAENIETIFKRFYTDRPAVDDFGKNSGLGLSISRQIVEAHQGTLMAENIVDPDDPETVRGARFIVRLPRE